MSSTNSANFAQLYELYEKADQFTQTSFLALRGFETYVKAKQADQPDQSADHKLVTPAPPSKAPSPAPPSKAPTSAASSKATTPAPSTAPPSKAPTPAPLSKVTTPATAFKTSTPAAPSKGPTLGLFPKATSISAGHLFDDDVIIAHIKRHTSDQMEVDPDQAITPDQMVVDDVEATEGNTPSATVTDHNGMEEEVVVGHKTVKGSDFSAGERTKKASTMAYVSVPRLNISKRKRTSDQSDLAQAINVSLGNDNKNSRTKKHGQKHHKSAAIIIDSDQEGPSDQAKPKFGPPTKKSKLSKSTAPKPIPDQPRSAPDQPAPPKSASSLKKETNLARVCGVNVKRNGGETRADRPSPKVFSAFAKGDGCRNCEEQGATCYVKTMEFKLEMQRCVDLAAGRDVSDTKVRHSVCWGCTRTGAGGCYPKIIDDIPNLPKKTFGKIILNKYNLDPWAALQEAVPVSPPAIKHFQLPLVTQPKSVIYQNSTVLSGSGVKLDDPIIQESTSAGISSRPPPTIQDLMKKINSMEADWAADRKDSYVFM
ncbi:hypothetical protein CPC08DRAFT_824800 [Agrocybe pediades]|nr:hypothetical protein CPC08DRAFT_824800 [Agrocybe pediades]